MTTWKQIGDNHKPRPITRFQRILNGERDHMHGYDDGEIPASERPAGYYDDDFTTGDPVIDNMSEEELALALNEKGIW